jgi:deoxycytidylate deaminase
MAQLLPTPSTPLLKGARGIELKGATIYIARMSRKGTPAMSRPCANCMKEIVKAGIRKIVYTNSVGMMSVEIVAELEVG